MSEWLTTRRASELLGVSIKHLWKLRDEGLLKQGKHWRNIARPMAARPTYRWNVKACEKQLEIDAAYRG